MYVTMYIFHMWLVKYELFLGKIYVPQLKLESLLNVNLEREIAIFGPFPDIYQRISLYSKIRIQ